MIENKENIFVRGKEVAERKMEVLVNLPAKETANMK
jgi:hypothetical protein